MDQKTIKKTRIKKEKPVQVENSLDIDTINLTIDASIDSTLNDSNLNDSTLGGNIDASGCDDDDLTPQTIQILKKWVPKIQHNPGEFANVTNPLDFDELVLTFAYLQKLQGFLINRGRFGAIGHFKKQGFGIV